MADAEIIMDARIGTERISKDLREAAKAVEPLKRDYEAVAKALATHNKILEETKNKLKDLEKSSKEYSKIESDLANANAKLREQEAIYDNISRQLKEAEKQRELAHKAVDIEAFEKAEKTIKDLTSELEKMSAEITKTEKSTINLGSKLSELKLPSESAEEAAKLSDKIIEMESSMLLTKMEADQLKKAMEDVFRATRKSGDEAAESASKTNSAFNRTSSLLSRLLGLLGSAYSHIRSISGRIYGIMRTIATGFTNAVQGVGQFNISIIRAINSIRIFNRDSMKSARMVDFLGRRAVRLAANIFIFNQIGKAIRALFGDISNLIKHNDDLQRSFNAIQVNLWTAFAPIWELIEPALVRFAAILAHVTQVLATFIAMLGGRTYQAAKDAGKALYDQAKAIDKVGGAAKRANKQMFAFDEVNQRITEDAGSAGDAADRLDFDIEPPSYEIVYWLQELIDLFKSMEFDELMQRAFDFTYNIMDNIKEMLDSIDWDYIREWAKGFGKIFSGLLNGIFANEDAWKSIGRTVGEAINTLLTGIESFIDNFNWRQVGQTLALALSDLFYAVDWEQLGRVVAKGLNGILEAINTFFLTADWDYYGRAFGRAINSFVDWFDAQLFGETLGNAINSAFDLLNGFIEIYNWGSIGNTLMESLTSMTETINWENIGTVLANGFNMILTDIYTFLNGYNWTKLGTHFTNLINKFMNDMNWKLLGNTLASLFNSSIDFLYGGINNFNWNKLGSSLGDFINASVQDINWRRIGETISNGFRGVLDSISTFLATVRWEDIGKAIFDFLAGIDWIGIFTDLMSIVAQTIQSVLELVAGIFGFSEAVKENQKVLEIFSRVVLAAFTGGMSEVVLAVKKVYNSFKDYTPEIVRYSDIISETTKKMLDPIIDNADMARNKLTELFIESLPVTSEGAAEIARHFTDMADTAIDALERMRDEAISNLAEIFGEEAKAYEKRLNETNKFYDNRIAEIDREEKRLNEALLSARLNFGEESKEYKNALGEFKTFTDGRVNQIQRIEKERDKELKNIRDNSGEEINTYLELRDNQAAIYDERIKNVQDSYDDLLKETASFLEKGESMESKHYKEMLRMSEKFLYDIIDGTVENDAERISLAETRVKDLETINKMHHDEIKKAADEEKDIAIEIARKRHDELIAQAKKLREEGTEEAINMAKALIKEADREYRESTNIARIRWREMMAATKEGGRGVNIEANKANKEFEIDFKKHWNSIVDWFKGLWEGVSSWFGTVWDRITGKTGVNVQQSASRGVSGFSDYIGFNAQDISSFSLPRLDTSTLSVDLGGNASISPLNTYNNITNNIMQAMSQPFTMAQISAMTETGARMGANAIRLDNQSIAAIINGITESFAMSISDLGETGMGGGGEREIVLQINDREFARGIIPAFTEEVDRLGLEF